LKWLQFLFWLFLYLNLEGEINWHQSHQDKTLKTSQLNQLFSLAGEFEEHYQKKSEILIYQTLGALLAGKETNLRKEINEQIEILKEKVEEIKEKGDKDPFFLERWLNEAEIALTKSEESQKEALGILDKLKSPYSDKQRIYQNAQKYFQESHQNLKEAHAYLQELIREVKHVD